MAGFEGAQQVIGIILAQSLRNPKCSPLPGGELSLQLKGQVHQAGPSAWPGDARSVAYGLFSSHKKEPATDWHLHTASMS